MNGFEARCSSNNHPFFFFFCPSIYSSSPTDHRYVEQVNDGDPLPALNTPTPVRAQFPRLSSGSAEVKKSIDALSVGGSDIIATSSTTGSGESWTS